MRNRQLGIVHAVIIIVLAGLAYASTRAAGSDDGLLHVYVLDVGQGDAIFIESPNHTQVLIDGGRPDNRVLEQLAEILPPLDRTIDAVVVTHPHADHIGGLSAVLSRYDVGAVVEATERYDSSEYRTWERAVDTEGATRVDAIAGTSLDLGGGVTLSILYPSASAQNIATKKPHSYNVTTLLTYGTTRMLLTGDMEGDAEQALINHALPIDVDVLKVGHHGSTTSSSTAFLNATSPRVALISVGARNTYHHPAPSTLARLERMGIPYYRTDAHGTVEVISDGATFAVIPEK
ncbi:MAG: ComEC/Rec2 family competence protein [Patescibacteria group bacterium]